MQIVIVAVMYIVNLRENRKVSLFVSPRNMKSLTPECVATERPLLRRKQQWRRIHPKWARRQNCSGVVWFDRCEVSIQYVDNHGYETDNTFFSDSKQALQVCALTEEKGQANLSIPGLSPQYMPEFNLSIHQNGHTHFEDWYANVLCASRPLDVVHT